MTDQTQVKWTELQYDDPGRKPFLSPLEYDRALKRGNWITGFGVLVSLIMTGYGLHMLIGKLLFTILLTAFSGGGTLFCYSLLFAVFPRAGGADKAKLAFLGFAVVVLLVVPTSTFFGMLGVAAPEAVKIDMQETAAEAQRRMTEQQKLRAAELAVVPALEASADEFEAMANDQVENRRFDSTRGNKESTPSQDLRAIGRGFEAAAKLVTDDEARLKTATSQAETALAELQRIAGEAKANAGSMHSSTADFTEQLRQFDLAMAALSRSSLDADVLAPIDAALRQQAQSPITTEKPKVREKQQAAKDTIHALATEAREKASKLLTDARPEAALEKPEPLSVPGPMEAVIKHFGRVAHTAAYPIAIDIALPLITLLALTLMRGRIAGGDPVARQTQVPYQPQPQPQPQPQENSDARSTQKHSTRIAKLEAARNHYHQARDR